MSRRLCAVDQPKAAVRMSRQLFTGDAAVSRSLAETPRLVFEIIFSYSRKPMSRRSATKTLELPTTVLFSVGKRGLGLFLNPFTPKSDQSNSSPAASPAILHNTVWRIWLFIACSDERWLYYQFSLSHAYICLWEGRENSALKHSD